MSNNARNLPDSDEARWFAAEVQSHEPALRLWLRRRFPSLTDVDDLVQDAYVRVLRTRRSEPHRIYVSKTYLFQIARNIAIDELRHREVRGRHPSDGGEEEGLLEDSPGVYELVTRREELELLADAIRALPDRCRQVVTLRKIYGLSQKEIAQRLGISEHTVEAHIGLGMHRCAKYLAQFRLP